MTTLQITTAITLIGLLTACETAPRYEAEFGNATRATLNAQIINPDAGNNPDPVAGLDGRAARDVINNYQNPTRLSCNFLFNYVANINSNHGYSLRRWQVFCC